MLFLVVLAVGLLTVRPLGGRFTTLASLHMRGAWLVALALLVQVLAISVLVRPPHLLAATLHVSSYCFAAVFLWINRRVRGLPLAAAGGALNLLAIGANGGTMPATAAALQAAGIRGDGVHFSNSNAVAHPRLGFLGDVFAVPESLGPLANVFSLGDVALALGAIWLLHAAAGCSWATSRATARSARSWLGAVPGPEAPGRAIEQGLVFGLRSSARRWRVQPRSAACDRPDRARTRRG